MSSESSGNDKTRFDLLLEDSAKADEIFDDKNLQLGADPFDSLEDENLSVVLRKSSIAEACLELINKNISFQELNDALLQIAQENIPCEAGSILEKDYDTEELFFRAVFGKNSNKLAEIRIPKGLGIAGFVCENQSPLTLNHTDKNAMHLRTISDLVGVETRNLVAMPIVIKDKTFGCIELMNRIGGEEFTSEDLEVLQKLTTCAAQVLENRMLLAQMYQELTHKRREVA